MLYDSVRRLVRNYSRSQQIA